MPPAYQFFAGVFFTLISLGILLIALRMRQLEPAQRDIIHFVCAFCAGAAGAFFTGTALFSLDLALSPGGRLFFQGTAGVALFAFVFAVFRFRYREHSIPPPDGSWVSPSGSNPFSQVATAIAEEVGATVDLSALTESERKVCPSSAQLDASTPALARIALLKLRELAPAGAIRLYDVDFDAAVKRFRISVRGE